MARNYICAECGRQFDGTLTHGFNKKNHRHVCPSCYRTYKREQRRQRKFLKQQRNLMKTGMKQSYLAMICKILLGFSFIASIFIDSPNGRKSAASEKLVAVCFGIILIAIGLIPFLLRKKKRHNLWLLSSSIEQDSHDLVAMNDFSLLSVHPPLSPSKAIFPSGPLATTSLADKSIETEKKKSGRRASGLLYCRQSVVVVITKKAINKRRLAWSFSTCIALLL